MADAFTDLINGLMNGKTYGIPNIYLLASIGIIVFLIYLYATKKPAGKVFKPMDIKKETKKRFKKEYKYFGMALGKNLYDADSKDDPKAKPVAFAIGYMKVVEMKQMKRLEPIYSNFPKERLEIKHEQNALEIYNKKYIELSDIEKKNIDEVSKDELRNERIETLPVDEKITIKHGRKEVKYPISVPMFMLKICSPDILSKVLARFLGVGMDWFLINKDQITFSIDRVTLNYSLQRRIFNDIFILSDASKTRIEDIGFGIEREELLSADANAIPRILAHEENTARQLLIRREEAEIERQKHKAQSESHDFG